MTDKHSPIQFPLNLRMQHSALKRIGLLTAALAITGSSLSVQSREERLALTVGVYSYPPLVNIVDGQISGSAIDDLGRIVRDAGYNVIYRDFPRARLVLALKRNDIDLAFPVYNSSSKDNSVLSREVSLVEIPGLCFRKDNFVPFLSAVNHWSQLNIVYPAGAETAPILKKYGRHLSPVFGDNVLERTIKMVASGRADAAYSPNISFVYNLSSKYYPYIACSSFFGYSTPVYIGVSNELPAVVVSNLRKIKDRINPHSEN